jgi:hypothetical protein
LECDGGGLIGNNHEFLWLDRIIEGPGRLQTLLNVMGAMEKI